MRAASTGCKLRRCGAALLLLAALLCLPAGAYSPAEPVGKPGMLLTAMSGNGSLSGESTLGSAAADAVRLAAGSDFALLCGGQFAANLEPKTVTYADICRLFADGDAGLTVVRVTPKALRQLLEHGLSRITLDETESIDRAVSAFGGFPQISGFTLTYDASAHPGERVMRICLDGRKLDLEDDSTVYTLALPAAVAEGAYGYPARPGTGLSVTLAEAMADYVASGVPDTYTGHDRITEVGCTEYDIINRVPAECAVAALCIWAATRLWKFKHDGTHTR